METVTFYSYKGGVGRTLLLAQCARHLARLGARVVALDFDLDAPGLHYRLARNGQLQPTRGLVDLIDDYVTTGKLYESLADASYDAGHDIVPYDPRAPGLLRVIPAGASPSRSYWQRLANIDWRSFLYGEAMGPEFLEDLRRHIEAEFAPDVLLVDSRTGITEIGHVTLSLLADRVVCVVSDRSENLDGAREVLRALCRTRRANEGRAPELLVAVSRPHPSVAWERREANVRAFLEEPGETLDDALHISDVVDLPYEPELDRYDRILIGTSAGRQSLLVEKTRLLAERLVSGDVATRVRDLAEKQVREAPPFPGCVWSYVQFATRYAELEIAAFVRTGIQCHIVCPELATLSQEDRKRAITWLAGNKAMGAPIDLVASAPLDALPIAEPSLEDLVELRDHPHTVRDLLFELGLRLPNDFPDFSGTEELPRFVVTVSRPLSPGEKTRLEQVFGSFQYGEVLQLEIVVATSTEELNTVTRREQGDVELLPSRWLPPTYSPAVRRSVEEDEDRWMACRMAVHRGEVNDPRQLLPSVLQQPFSRILIDPTFAPWCVPAVLPLADQVLLILPLGDFSNSPLAKTGLDIASICTMAESGRLIAVLPQSVDRYDPELVNALAERAPKAIVGSRRLGAAVIVAMQRRLGPWFFPTFGVRERRERLHRRVIQNQQEAHTDSIGVPLDMLRDHWSRCEVMAHRFGGLAPMFGGGLGELVAHHLLKITGRDLRIEASHASAVVTWAAALRAIVVPHHHKDYSELGLSLMAARMLTTWGPSHVPWRNAPKVGYSCSSSGDTTLAQELWGRPEAGRVRRELASALEGGVFDAAPLGAALDEWNQTVHPSVEGKALERFAVGAPHTSAPSVGAAQMRWMRDLLSGSVPDLTDVADQGDPEASSCAPLLVLAPDLMSLGEGAVSEAGSGEGA